MERYEQQLLPEEAIDNGRGILIRHKTLFHGSSVTDINKLNFAEETTVGEGIYFTSEQKDAEGYATRRTRSRSSYNEKVEPVVYRADIENLKFFDARKDSNVMEVLKGFLEILSKEKQTKELNWVKEATLSEAIEKIQNGKINPGNLREIAFSHGQLFTDYIKSLGYDGLIAIEGGEGEDIGEHDTYLVFDPEKIKGLSSGKK